MTVARRPIAAIEQVTGLAAALAGKVSLGDIVGTTLGPFSTDTQNLAARSVREAQTDFFSAISTNLANRFTVTPLTTISATTGALVANASNSTSDFIAVTPGATYTSYRVARKAFYGIGKAFIAGSSNTTDGTWVVPADAYYVRIVSSGTSGAGGYWAAQTQLNAGGTLLAYEPYYRYIDLAMVGTETITPSKLSISNYGCFVSGDIDFSFGINNAISFSNVRLSAQQKNLLVDQSLDISALSTSYTYILHYDTATDLLGTTNLSSTVVIPATAVLICGFRIGGWDVYGLNRYKINGVKVGHELYPGGLDKFVMDSDVSGRYDAAAPLADLSATVNSSTAASVYALYDALVTAHPTYVSRTLLCNEASPSELPVYAYTFSPPRPANTGTNATPAYPKMLLSSGLHGNETTGVFSLYHLMSAVSDSWASNPILEALRFNVDFVVVPMGNPWGYDQSPRSRKNYNGVDLARNFPFGWSLVDPSSAEYGGTAPLTEPEAQAIDTVMRDNLDCIAVLDFHNYTANVGSENYIWTPVANTITRSVGQGLIQRMSRKWRAEHAFVSQDDDVMFGNTSGESPGGSHPRQAVMAYGILYGGTFETSSIIYADEHSVNNDDDALTFGYEASVNLIAMILNDARRR